MKTLHWSMALLLTFIVGLGGCAHEMRTVSDPHPVTAADLQAVLRDEWSRHLFWIRNVFLDHAKNDLRSRDFAEKAVAANAKEIARTFKSFYGEPASYRLTTLLTQHYEAVKAYSLATVAGNKQKRDAAMAESASNNEEIAAFLSGINPHLSKETVRSLFAAHDADIHDHINKLQDKDYAGEEETWPAMEHHVYVIADTLAAAVVKQFPKRFM
jgi:hypothetical protein